MHFSKFLKTKACFMQHPVKTSVKLHIFSYVHLFGRKAQLQCMQQNLFDTTLIYAILFTVLLLSTNISLLYIHICL